MGFVFFLLIVGLVGGAVYYKLTRPKAPPTLQKPPNTFGDADFFTLEDCNSEGLLSGVGIPLGYYTGQKPKALFEAELKAPLPPGVSYREIREFYREPLHYAGERHLVTIAPTRTGKGTTAQLPALLEHDASLFMIDPKGENAAIAAKCRRDVMGHAVYVVNPFGVLGEDFKARGFAQSARFNPLASLDPDGETYMAEVSALCEALILGEGKEPHWTDSARDLVSARILWACKYGKPEDKTLPAVRDFLTLDQAAFLEAVATMAACDDVPIRNKAMRFIKSREELDSVISTAQTQTAFLDDPLLRESLTGDDFRFIDLKRKKMSVFLVLPAKLIPPYAKWFRLMVVSALDALMSTEEKGAKPVLLMLDEFASLGHLSSVENAMGLAAGFGVQLWPFVQDIHQLEDIYAKRWKSFLANAGVQQYFTPNDVDTAKHISERAGSKTVIVEGATQSEISKQQAQGGFTGLSKSAHEIERPLLNPNDLFSLESYAGLIFLTGNKNTLKYGRLSYRENDKYKGLWDENPYFANKAPPAPATAPLKLTLTN